MADGMQLVMSIGAVERDTGLSKDTLRVWERRYGFPQPSRDAQGERSYPLEQVERLRLIKRLLDQGHRPGKVITYGIGDLRALAVELANRSAAAESVGEERADLLHYIALCKAYKFDEMRRSLSQDLMKLGLYRFVVGVIAPLNTMVGVRWANGTFAVFEEHLYTESVQIVMRNAIASIPMNQQADIRPRVLLTTFPQEQHGLGLLMAEAIFALEGARCISLGVQTPIMDIARAAETQRADIVALSFSASMNANQLNEGVRDLRAKLPAATEIWAGGGCVGLQRRPPAELLVLDLPDVAAELNAWRNRRPA
jgi:MerR family transcriptional regulator, light-induced transcriptional regulator